MNQTDSNTDEDYRKFDAENDGQSLDDLIARAVEAAAKGENVDQLLEVMLAELPNKAKDKTRKKFAAALAKRGLKPLSNEVADIPSRATLARMRNALALSTKQMVDRIMQLVRARPDIAAELKQAGTALTQNGVMADKVAQVSETELGAISPSATGRAQPDRGAGRGA